MQTVKSIPRFVTSSIATPRETVTIREIAKSIFSKRQRTFEEGLGVLYSARLALPFSFAFFAFFAFFAVNLFSPCGGKPRLIRFFPHLRSAAVKIPQIYDSILF